MAHVGWIVGVMLMLTVLMGSGRVMLQWDLPTEHEDGSLLTDLMSIHVHYGLSVGVYAVEVDAGLATSAVLAGLAEEQPYYVAVTAHDTSGQMSRFSNEVVALPVPDSPPDLTSPVVRITNPANGATVRRKDPVTIQAEATDDRGIRDVTFTVSAAGAVVQTCVDGQAEYLCTWDVHPANHRVYQVQAVAVDIAGNVSVPDRIEVIA